MTLFTSRRGVQPNHLSQERLLVRCIPTTREIYVCTSHFTRTPRPISFEACTDPAPSNKSWTFTHLSEHAVRVPDPVPPGRQVEGGHGIEEAGSQTAEPSVSECSVTLQVCHRLKVVPQLCTQQAECLNRADEAECLAWFFRREFGLFGGPDNHLCDLTPRQTPNLEKKRQNVDRFQLFPKWVTPLSNLFGSQNMAIVEISTMSAHGKAKHDLFGPISHDFRSVAG